MKNKTLTSTFIVLLVFVFGCAPKYTPPPGVSKHAIHFVDSIIYTWRHDTVMVYDGECIKDVPTLCEVKRDFFDKNGKPRSEKLNQWGQGYRVNYINAPLSMYQMEIKVNVAHRVNQQYHSSAFWREAGSDPRGNLRTNSIRGIRGTSVYQVFDKGSGYYIDVAYWFRRDTLTRAELDERYPQDLVNTDTDPRVSKTLYHFYDDRGLESRAWYRYLGDSLFVVNRDDAYIIEEGQLKNNYKVGEWKYYNEDRTIKRTRNYKKREKVDIRFPICLFNKVEPCFCDE